MQKSTFLAFLLAVVTTVAVSWSSQMYATDSDTLDSDATSSSFGSGPLDGMTFIGALGPDGKPKDIADTFVFENGTFVSKECELNCKYPARPYFVRVNGAKT